MSQNGVFVWFFLGFGLLPSIYTTHSHHGHTMSFTLLLPPTTHFAFFPYLPSQCWPLLSWLSCNQHWTDFPQPSSNYSVYHNFLYPSIIHASARIGNSTDEWLGEDSFIQLISLCCNSSTDNFSYISPSFSTTSLIYYQIAQAQVPTLSC